MAKKAVKAAEVAAKKVRVQAIIREQRVVVWSEDPRYELTLLLKPGHSAEELTFEGVRAALTREYRKAKLRKPAMQVLRLIIGGKCTV